MARSMPQYMSSAIAVIPREYAPPYFLPVGILAGPLSEFGLNGFGDECRQQDFCAPLKPCTHWRRCRLQRCRRTEFREKEEKGLNR